jgi:hypothetical protein
MPPIGFGSSPRIVSLHDQFATIHRTPKTLAETEVVLVIKPPESEYLNSGNERLHSKFLYHLYRYNGPTSVRQYRRGIDC